MELISENIHIISKKVREAIVTKNEAFITDIIKNLKTDIIDLNVGPARADLTGSLTWLCKLVQEHSNASISFDTSNVNEMKNALDIYNDTSKCFVNSASADCEKLESMTDLSANFNTKLIALTLNSSVGIPKTADGRLELALEIYETCMMKGITNDRIYFDPLVLPLSVDQSQAIETLNTVKIIKESFDPVCKTVIGLSNISNGSPNKLRPLINKVYLALAFGAGLDAAIIDGFDTEIISMINMLETNSAKTKADKLLIDLTSITRDFIDISDINFDKNDKMSSDIYKAAKILTNNEIYSHSFTQV